MKFFLFLFFTSLLITDLVSAQVIYSRSFGDSKGKPIIFLHGGPGSSSIYFETQAAQKLANQGFYVIIYDRRGEGRSVDTNAKINFEEAFNDLNHIYKKYELTRANLIGFSFGGIVTTLYAQKYPERVKAIILVSSLISQQQSYNTILKTTKVIYENRKDTVKLRNLVDIQKLDTNSIEYRTDVFKHASENGYFTLKNPDSLARVIYASCDTNTLIKNYVKNDKAVQIFWKNELQKNIDITPILIELQKKKMPIYALYGKQDGLYSINQIESLKKIVGDNNFRYLNNCSHTVFIDQQQAFISSLTGWIR